ncbi:hypothetical protein SteCoe_36484 [Stentor coeruleus]|uniref:Uncharacterized protein n=1 Tax=Stentor coeruleus TaxID=5963 RepID=A0A1R2AQ92_9CILI|nr:hypothetical protein SteCoe_36484 [Stentor coeruleus]
MSKPKGNQYRPVKSKVQLTVRDFAPMQEIADSIYDNLVKVSKLEDGEEKEFLVLKRRINMQAICMQGVLEDRKFSESEQFDELIKFFNAQRRNQDNSFYVRECLKDALSILKNETNIDSFTFNKPKHASSTALTNFFKSQNYIDERMDLSETDPEAYKNSAKIKLYSSDADTKKALFKNSNNDYQTNTDSTPKDRGKTQNKPCKKCPDCASPKKNKESFENTRFKSETEADAHSSTSFAGKGKKVTIEEDQIEKIEYEINNSRQNNFKYTENTSPIIKNTEAEWQVPTTEKNENMNSAKNAKDTLETKGDVEDNEKVLTTEKNENMNKYVEEHKEAKNHKANNRFPIGNSSSIKNIKNKERKTKNT